MSSENYLIHDQHAVHFPTFTVIEWIDIFTRANYKIEIANALEYCQKNKGLRLYAWCLMTNHLHLVCQTTEPHTLSEFVRDFKKHTAKTIVKKFGTSPRAAVTGYLKHCAKQVSTITVLPITSFGKKVVTQYNCTITR